MNRLLSVLLIAAAASLFLAAAPETPAVSGPAPVDLRIEVAPTTYGPYELLRQQHADTYTCSAMLFDEAHRAINMRAEVVLRPGEELTKTTASRGYEMTLKGRVDAARTGAVAEVTVRREGVLIAHQQSRVFLSRTARSQVY
ncbi:MAG: hypothetical protein QOE82_1469 [Thermoanaerobaculia bacterium]|jgi:hypothetical protein|nr:hypothetical protein [Thermoanaerobaculia bacterium]